MYPRVDKSLTKPDSSRKLRDWKWSVKADANGAEFSIDPSRTEFLHQFTLFRVAGLDAEPIKFADEIAVSVGEAVDVYIARQTKRGIKAEKTTGRVGKIARDDRRNVESFVVECGTETDKTCLIKNSAGHWIGIVSPSSNPSRSRKPGTTHLAIPLTKLFVPGTPRVKSSKAVYRQSDIDGSIGLDYWLFLETSQALPGRNKTDLGRVQGHSGGRAYLTRDGVGRMGEATENRCGFHPFSR